MKWLTLFFMMILSSTVLAETKVAVVKLLRGEVDVLTIGKTTKLKVNDWVENGSVIKTAEKSFVKLVFLDKSQMNVGPNSEMKIETFSGKDSGVIDLVKGKIRSQVTKDYLQIKDKDKSKLFIKTQNAVLGVRGTDFIISTNGKNTSTVLFEGEIVFNKLEQRGEVASRNLEEVVNRGVRMFPGEFSVMEANRPMPTVPSLLNIQQREHLEKNAEFDSNRAPGNANAEAAKSVVPEGLSGQQVSNNVETLKNEVAQVSAIAADKKVTPSSADPDGYIKGNLIKPANGSFVHVESGVIIPPGPDAILDSNTNTYIPGQTSGNVAADGSYIPPANIEITNDGKILVATTDDSGAVLVKEILPPPPVVTSTSVSMTEIASGTTPTTTTTTSTSGTISDIPLPGTEIVSGTSGTGGLQGVNDPQRAASEYSNTTIRVRNGN